MRPGSRFVITTILFFVAAVLLLPGLALAGPEPNCVGTDACLGNTGEVGERACNGRFACLDNAGDIGKLACIDVSACRFNTAPIGEGACQGQESCRSNAGAIQKGACEGSFSCLSNSGTVGEGACQGFVACTLNAGAIQKGACIGENACNDNEGAVGEGSCIGVAACSGQAASIGKLSCRGERACLDRSGGTIGDSSCVGKQACEGGGSGAIGKSACRGERACLNNPGPIAKGTCNGPPDPTTGKGVCELQQHDCADQRAQALARRNDAVNQCAAACAGVGECTFGCIIGGDALSLFIDAEFTACQANSTGSCEALRASNLAYCASQPSVPLECRTECNSVGDVCEQACVRVADCDGEAEAAYAYCVQTQP